MSEPPFISVVIATYKRCEVLQVTLEKLCEQSLAPSKFEVLVVDDGSNDGTDKMVASLMGSTPYALRYFEHANRGPGYTQNRGIREAHGDLILLIADDIWASPMLLEQHLKTHGEYPDKNVAVLGKVVQSSELPSTVMHKYWDPFRYDRFREGQELNSIFFLACNISVKKDFLLENGMYEERKGAAHEDIELGYRLGKKGLRIIYNQDALTSHYHVETLVNACKRAYERGRNFDLLSENIPKSFIFPIYKICSIEAGVKAFVKMIPREIPRVCIFNQWTVNYFWLPILQFAEANRLAAIFANQATFRGTIYYFLRKGYKDARREEQKETCLCI